MNKDLHKARNLLESEGYTCVLCRDEAVYIATDRGVKPLVAWLDEKADLAGFSAADKVVGKATAFLYCLLGVKAVYAHVMSAAAKEVLCGHGLAAECGKQVEAIINRRGDGPCPFEAAVWEIQDPREALQAIYEKQKQMKIH